MTTKRKVRKPQKPKSPYPSLMGIETMVNAPALIYVGGWLFAAKDCRRLAKWLLAAADWCDAVEKKGSGKCLIPKMQRDFLRRLRKHADVGCGRAIKTPMGTAASISGVKIVALIVLPICWPMVSTL